MQVITTGWRFWLLWGAAFLGFPIAGILSNLLGPVSTPARALLAGLISGAVIGAAEWLVLRNAIALPSTWIAATALGFAVGLALSTALLGSEVEGSPLLWRAALTGLCIGLAQWFVLRGLLPQALLWIPVMALAWTAGWYVTRAAGINLSFKWSVFGSSGALTFQLITGLALALLFKR